VFISWFKYVKHQGRVARPALDICTRGCENHYPQMALISADGGGCDLGL